MDNEQEFEYVDATTCGEYIAAAYNAINAIEGIDDGLLDSKGKSKIKLIRSRSINIIYSCIMELHGERFPETD
jgi:hypothetical protein